MRTILAALLAAMLVVASTPGRACDDHQGTMRNRRLAVADRARNGLRHA